MAISVKTMCLLAFLLVLLSRSEVEKTFRADSFSNGSEASCRGTTHNSHKLHVRVERIIRVANLLDNPFIHGTQICQVVSDVPSDIRVLGFRR